MKFAYALFVLAATAGYVVNGESYFRGANRRRLAGCKTWPSSTCLYTPWNENKFGDHNRVQTRYYNGHHIGRFDEDDEVDFLPFFEQSDEDDSIGHRPTKKCRSSAARHTECN